jgi:hypothetical protein
MVSERDDSPGPGDANLRELESLLRRRAVPGGPGSIRFVGGTVLLRVLPAAVMLAGLITLASAGIDALPAAAALVLIGVLAARSAPWRFVVVDEGIALWFAFGRRRFLARTDLTVRMDLTGAVARPRSERFGYPLTDGVTTRRRSLLRAILTEHGFDICT